MIDQNIAEQIEQNDNTSVHVSDELISDIVLGLEEDSKVRHSDGMISSFDHG